MQDVIPDLVGDFVPGNIRGVNLGQSVKESFLMLSGVNERLQLLPA